MDCECVESGECTCEEYNCICGDDCSCGVCSEGTVEFLGQAYYSEGTGCGCGGNCACGMQEEEMD